MHHLAYPHRNWTLFAYGTSIRKHVASSVGSGRRLACFEGCQLHNGMYPTETRNMFPPANGREPIRPTGTAGVLVSPQKKRTRPLLLDPLDLSTSVLAHPLPHRPADSRPHICQLTAQHKHGQIAAVRLESKVVRAGLDIRL